MIDFDDDKGISLCIVKSDKFKNLSSSLECLPVDFVVIYGTARLVHEISAEWQREREWDEEHR